MLVSPRLEGLTELRLQLSSWEEAEGTAEAERLLGRDPCPAAEVMVRIIRPLTALQVRRLQAEGLLLLLPLDLDASGCAARVLCCYPWCC